MIAQLLNAIADAVIRAINALVVALASIIQTIFDALPDMPMLPTPPDEFTMIYGWVAWVFPVGTVIDILTFTLSVFLVWQVAALALRWAKATNS